MGNRIPISYVRSLIDSEGKVLYQFEPEVEQSMDPAPVAELVSMMKQTIESGTAKYVNLVGFNHPAAGKTGTTSDNKDAWFSGFTPNVAAVVWVGYDDNTVMGLTGAAAALPIWIQTHKALQDLMGGDERFKWPAEVSPRTLTRFELQDRFPSLKELPDSIELVFSH